MNHTTVSDIMQANVFTVEEDWTLDQLARFLTDKQISGAPVNDSSGKLTGVVSVTDIVGYDGSPVSESADSSTHEYYLRSLENQVSGEEIPAFSAAQDSAVTVRDIMTPMVFQINEDASIRDAADTMVRGHIHRLFVTRDNRISGVITALDMMKVIRDADTA